MGGKSSVTFSEHLGSFEQSKINGSLAEKVACTDYISNGYSVRKISHGGDFTVTKIGSNEKRNECTVEVKYNTSKLSKKQVQTKKNLKNNYTVYRVSEQLLDGFKNEESAFLIPDTLSRIMGDQIQHGAKYHIAVPATCPHCENVAWTLDEVVAVFGLRKMNDDSIRNQSWCKDCRWGAMK